ncbi:DUF4262 domain-containing protein [Chryseobacterium flavum]|uniref:DUF4262 domain-containing protein n=1 Tax=Chryseobacterium flavum TaxID=415851 RepID=UPI002FDAD2D3
MESKKEFLELIRSNIENNSFHITIVEQSKNPRYAYSIGNYQKYGFELILAGNENFLYEDVIKIFNNIVSNLIEVNDIEKEIFNIQDLGLFYLEEIHDSWKSKMMLGVYDYYHIENFKAYQIIPDKSNYTLDIPVMRKEWTAQSNTIWQWLDDNIQWNLDVPETSTVVTEIDVLLGKKATEIMRWEEDEWQAFTKDGNEVDENNIRVISIATILGIDSTLFPITNLDVGKGLWRSADELVWNDWG